jgi:hypothetical protein
LREAARNVEPPFLSGPRNDEDPNKLQFGGSPRRNGRTLTADVAPLERGWYEVTLRVAAESRRRRLRPGTPVEFHLHDTFTTPVRRIRVKADGTAELHVRCWGAFTVGVRIKGDVGGETMLELDLALMHDAPMRFRTS